MDVFWVVVGRLRMDRVMITLTIKAGVTSETLANLYQSTRCYNPQDSHLQGVKACTKRDLAKKK
jgi:hypothetical protein